MKAIVYKKYGSVENLRYTEIPKPVPGDNEVLVKVKAASVNSWDWDLVLGKPFIARLAGGGLFKPRKPVLGCDIAGVVESAGSNVTEFQPGDEVFGDISGCNWGGFAEYVSADAAVLARKPSSISFEDAAAIPQAGVLALQAFNNAGRFSKGFKLLINGAGGGVGTFAIQLAKLQGAEVTCVDRGNKLELLKSLGADDVIDYTTQEINSLGKTFNMIIDNVADNSISGYSKLLMPEGKVIVVGGETSVILKIATAGSWLPKEGKKMKLLMHKPNRNDLNYLAELVENGSINPIINKIYNLEETADAILELGRGEVKGKNIILIRH